MRGRRRSRSGRRNWSAVCISARGDTRSGMESQLDRGLREIVRLLARQAAREVFERERGSAHAAPVVPEDVQ